MMDAASRQLIERAAAHLRRRDGGSVPEPQPFPVAANGDWGSARMQSAPPRAQAAPAQPVHAQPAPERAAPEYVTHGNTAAARAPRPQPQAIDDDETQHSASRHITLDRNALRRHGIALPSSGRSRIAEEFRLVKRQVVARYIDETDAEAELRSNRVIMVTSAKPGEGKTFAAVNLALSIASEQDLKVLLIDLDTRNHAMQEMMGIPAGRGLTDLLSNPDVDFSDVVLRTNLGNLAVMPAGHPDNRGPELLSSKRARNMFEEMTQRYSDRFIIFDAPSVLSSSDAATLATLVGQVVFVVEADQTQQEEIEAALSIIRVCPNISLLLNKVRASATDQFGSHSGR